MNQATLIGNLTRDPELRYTAGGSPLCKLGLAINENWKDKSTGTDKKKTCFVDVTVWGAAAERVAQYAKGREIMVIGKLNFQSWEDKSTGAKRSKLEVKAERIYSTEDQEAQSAEPISSNETIPF